MKRCFSMVAVCCVAATSAGSMRAQTSREPVVVRLDPALDELVSTGTQMTPVADRVRIYRRADLETAREDGLSPVQRHCRKRDQQDDARREGLSGGGGQRLSRALDR